MRCLRTAHDQPALAVPDPHAFGLSSFAELLPARDPIIGEVPGAFARFHAVMMLELAPATPYECVIAENLIALEWEMLQHRRMRNTCIREVTRESHLQGRRRTAGSRAQG